MSGQYDRTELLLGAGALRILRQSRVAVFGLGGVGGYVVEALARSGIGTLDLVDNDRISVRISTVSFLPPIGPLGVSRRTPLWNGCGISTLPLPSTPAASSLGLIPPVNSISPPLIMSLTRLIPLPENCS